MKSRSPYNLTLSLLASAILVVLSAGRAIPSDAPIVAGFERFYREAGKEDRVRGGRLLIGELSCVACHRHADPQLQPKGGPSLSGVALRLEADWLERFLLDPHAVKSGTTMPNLLMRLVPEDREQAAQELIAFLSTQRATFANLSSTATDPIALQFWMKGDSASGKRLYHNLGCVACHEPDADFEPAVYAPSQVEQLRAQLDPDEFAELGLGNASSQFVSVPHADLPSKYTREGLTRFLLDPPSVRPSNRMPGFGLDPAQAADLAAYLQRDQLGSLGLVESTDPLLVQRGKERFHDLGCINCHVVSGELEMRDARPLSTLRVEKENGCLALDQTLAPDFSLDVAQTSSIQLAVADLVETGSSRTVGSLADSVAIQMERLNCYACHERGMRGGVGPRRRPYFEVAGHVDLGDEGRLPPALNGVGNKLKAGWIKQVLDGNGRVRPHMLARMPRFESVSESLSLKIVAADNESNNQTGALSDQQVFGSSDATENALKAGRTLLDNGCVQCHPLRGEHLPGVVGVDLSNIHRRITPAWFKQFLRDPAQLKPRTRMPNFFADGQSSNQAILGGDIDRQIAAMWIYLRELDSQPLPQKLEQGRAYNFELTPTDQPIILRTFMRDVGTHAIAVGFPDKIHLAFDADSVRPALAWRGRFLDAHGTWFDRFTPPAAPLGERVISFPNGNPFSLSLEKSIGGKNKDLHQKSENQFVFRGYRLGMVGTPTFLYSLSDFEFEDRFEPLTPRGLVRKLSVQTHTTDGPALIWFRAHALLGSLQRDGNVVTGSDGLSVEILNLTDQRTPKIGDASPLGELRIRPNKIAEWLVPIYVKERAVIKVLYEW